MKNFALLFGKCALALSLCMLFSGCSLFEFNEDPDDPDSPNVSVSDPEGTIMGNVRNVNNGATRVTPAICGGYFGIGPDNNFYGSGYGFATVGSMNGIGNITKIPASGWASGAAVRKGYGYVGVYVGSLNNTTVVTYFRIYVDDNIIGTNNGVLGARIKYHSPFIIKQNVNSISVSKTEVNLSSTNSYSETISVSPYLNSWLVEVSESWCWANVTDMDKLQISANSSGRGKTATVTIKMDGLPDRTIKVTVAN